MGHLAGSVSTAWDSWSSGHKFKLHGTKEGRKEKEGRKAGREEGRKEGRNERTNEWTKLTSKETEWINKIFPTKKSPGPDGFTGEFYQAPREELTPILFELCQKTEEEGTLHNSPPWYQSQILQKKENYRPIFLMNTDVKIFKTLANWIQWHIKRIIYHDQVGFILAMQR